VLNCGPEDWQYNPDMELKRIVQDSGDVGRGRRLLGNIRAYLYIGVVVFLSVVYVWNHYRIPAEKVTSWLSVSITVVPAISFSGF
jgi:hypothetical protein